MFNKMLVFMAIAICTTTSFAKSYFGDFTPISGQLDHRHILDKDNFIKNNLKTNDYYDLIKINAFLSRIENERDFFLSNLYETKLIEEIELQISKPKKALEDAQEELDEKKSDFAIAFNQYLIPRIEKLAHEVQKDFNCLELCHGIVDEFLEVYSSFYSPNKYRSYFTNDYNLRSFYKHRNGYSIPLHNANIEASNLLIPTNLLERTTDCLQEKIGTQIFLTQHQIQKLKSCNIDISLLNPGKSIYWNESSETIHSVFSRYDQYFPTDQNDLYFKKVKFSGKGSPKINSEFERNGVEYKVKLKIGGYEAHTENFIGRIGKLIGFYQDVSIYKKSQKVIFEDHDEWNEFQSFMHRKYGNAFDNNLYSVESWGRQGKIATFRHVSLEISPKNLHKLSSPDVFGWDKKNLREFRGALLWFGYFNLADIKNGNWRLQLRETSKGLQPEMSLQDVGYAFGSGGTFNNLIEASRIITDGRNINSFKDSFLVKKRDSLVVKWNDPMSYEKLFDTTTYADLKWMARKILRVSVSDLKYLLAQSGYSEAEQRIYLHKISARRDEIISVFDLEKEFKPARLGSYKNINIDGIVKDGEVIASSTDSVYEYVDSNILLNIGQFIQQNIDIGGFDSSLQASIGSRLGVTVNPSLPFSIVEDKDFSFYIARPGIELGFSREIKPAQFIRYEEGADQKYYAIDRYTFGLTTRSGIQATLAKFFPVEMRAKISHFKFTFDHYRPFTTPGEALKAPATILQVLPRLKEYIKYMERNESITYSSDTEFSFRARIGRGQNYRFGIKQDRISSEPITIHKNKFAEFEIFQEKIKIKSNYVQLSAGIDTPLIYIPLLSIDHAFTKYNSNSKMFHFPLETQNLNDAISQYYMDTDQSLINDLLNGNAENPLLLAKMKYDLETNATSNSRRSMLAFLLSGKRDEIYSNSKLNFEGNNKNFHRYYYASSDTLGIDNNLSAHLLWSKDKTTVEIQMDEDDPEDFVLILNNYDFKKDLTKYGLDVYLKQQNEMYSKDGASLFFDSSIIPASNEVNHYKKVMSHVRVFLYGKGLLKKLDKYWDSELNQLVSNHIGSKLNPVDFAKARGIYNDLRTARTLHRENKLTTKAFLSSVGKAIYGLKTREKGVQILEKLFGKKHIFVMGEIHGILPSFNYTQNFNNKATRRFTGKSWGKYRKRPPFWKFLKDFPIQVRPGMIPYRIADDLIFSDLPTSSASLN